MRLLLLIFLFFHGLIHLIGFVKGFFPAALPKLSFIVSSTAAVFWLITTLLFLFSGILFLLGKSGWASIALVATVISAVLIIAAWQEARFGMIANFLILIAAIVAIGNQQFERKVRKEMNLVAGDTRLVAPEILQESDIRNLPENVRSWLISTGAVGRQRASTVTISQDFKMKLKPEQENWYNAQARQFYNVEHPGFIWTVDLKMNPLIQVSGRDKFYDGKGAMEMRMNGFIPLGNETGPKMDEGTLQRFLGEIVWFPSAATSEFITWEAIDIQTSKAVMNYRGTSGSGTFYFGKDGHFERFEAMRYMGNKADAKKYLWEIRVLEDSTFNGITVPSKCEAIWHLDEGQWKWCEIEITSLAYNLDDENFNFK
ncbi:MAG: hypothetical protein KJ578_14105 [Bacteroidetes bacterium]|nr:hypothetical protein [Bacteroidota bacterium]MBU1579737.1 hypothetical protein [Bacteroidota bacterium]MBU2558907.1 hypothetical protein [Bacteroidota bacterium]